MLTRAAVIASLLLPALAHADDQLMPPAYQPVVVATPTPPPAAPPPQTDDWSNVSHINGQIVKVGERGDYLINNHQHTNIAVDPFGPFVGYYDASITHAISQNIAVSGSLAVWTMENGSHTGYQATGSLPIFFRRTFSGPYLEPGLITRSSSYSDPYACSGCASDSTSHSWFGPELLFGWQWTFDSGLNIAMAAGVAKRATDSSSDMTTSSSSGNEANGYFRVGYAF
jgi:hypothetical protein